MNKIHAERKNNYKLTKDSWIVEIVTKARNEASKRNKIEELEYKTLKMLQAIANFKLNQQVIIFTQIFKRSIEYNLNRDLDNIENRLVQEFNLLFQIY